MTPERIREIALVECPDEQEIIYFEQIERAARTAVNEVLSEAVERIDILYKNPPAAYVNFALREGWNYALDVAEQQINALKLP